MADTEQPFIIKKIKKAGHAHHGGAWKIAYADFVTAMMALFIVLWLMNTSKQVQEAIGGYFKDPSGTSKLVGTNMQGSGENFTVTRVPPRKSMLSGSPCQNSRDKTPITLSSSERPTKYHFLPRKSIFGL